jgi:hypothetical protein
VNHESGVKRVRRTANAGVCVAENYAPVGLRLHRRRHKEMMDGDPTCEIWMWAKKDPKNLSFVLEHGEQGQY